MIRALGLASIAIGLLTSGCGGDSSQDTTQPTAISIPTITSPIPTTSTTGPATTESTTTESTTTSDKNRKGADPNQPDSPSNDVPPSAGSPQEAFEKHCQQNPEACG